MDPDPPLLLTPAELCQRWRIHGHTLRKLDLPWTRLSPRVRRIALAVVLAYEEERRRLR